jgi:hypothetical protein
MGTLFIDETALVSKQETPLSPPDSLYLKKTRVSPQEEQTDPDYLF